MTNHNRKEVIDLLLNKEKLDLTWREIADKTGYHEKYLIRLNKKIKKGIDVTTSNKKSRIPHNKIDDSIKNKIIELYKQNNILSKKDFYNHFIKEEKCQLSYSRMCFWLQNISFPKEKNMLILKIYRFNNSKYFIAVDYETENVLCIIKSNYSNLENWIRLMTLIIKDYGLPNNLYDYGFFTHQKDFVIEVCKTLKVNYLSNQQYNFSKLFRHIRYNLNNYILDKNNIFLLDNYQSSYKKIKVNPFSFYIPKTRKIIGKEIIQLNNKRYHILSRKKLPHIVTIYHSYDYQDVYVKVNNRYYKTKVFKNLSSFKGQGKY